MQPQVRPVEWEDVISYTDEIGNELGRLQRLRERALAHHGWRGPDGIDFAAFRCLLRLIEQGPMRSGALAEAVYSDPSTVSRHVAQLVSLGFVERRADPDDGRASVLAVTTEGEEAAARMRHRRNSFYSEILHDWSEGDRAELLRLLRKLLDRYECYRLE